MRYTNGGIVMHTKRQKLICVVGESCSGKDTIVKEASKYLIYGGDYIVNVYQNRKQIDKIILNILI